MNKKSVIQDFPGTDHDHSLCVDEALVRAEAICHDRGERFTPLRRMVFELVWTSHRPIKAYDLLDMVSQQGRRCSPPTVYRALDFLQAAGLVHRIDSRNAFIGCGDPGRPHNGQFLICDQCGMVAELENSVLAARLDADARRLSFELQSVKIEATGRCKACSQAGPSGN